MANLKTIGVGPFEITQDKSGKLTVTRGGDYIASFLYCDDFVQFIASEYGIANEKRHPYLVVGLKEVIGGIDEQLSKKYIDRLNPSDIKKAEDTYERKLNGGYAWTEAQDAVNAGKLPESFLHNFTIVQLKFLTNEESKNIAGN